MRFPINALIYAEYTLAKAVFFILSLLALVSQQDAYKEVQKSANIKSKSHKLEEFIVIIRKTNENKFR
jgi:hypothetical protein